MTGGRNKSKRGGAHCGSHKMTKGPMSGGRNKKKTKRSRK